MNILANVLQLLRNGDPVTILEVADRDKALIMATDILRTDADARREFANASTLGAYLWSLARPEERSAHRRLPEAQRRQAALAQAAEARRAAIAAEVEAVVAAMARKQALATAAAAAPVALSATKPDRWGTVDELAATLECRAPLLRLPSSVRILADHGIEPERHGRVERWPLAKVKDAAAVRRAMVLAAAAGVFVDSGLPIAIG